MRQRKPKDAWVRFHGVENSKLREGQAERSISLVGRGKSAYLWIGLNDKYVASFSGRQALRALANAILENVT